MSKVEDLVTATIFKKALKGLLNENEGIIIEIDMELKPLYPGVDKVIVFKTDNIHIIEYDGDLKNGEFIDIKFENDD